MSGREPAQRSVGQASPVGSHDILRRRLGIVLPLAAAASAGAVALLGSGCALIEPASGEAIEPPAQPPTAQRPDTGRVWRYQEIDLFSGRVSDEVSARVIGTESESTRIEVVTKDGEQRGIEIWVDVRSLRADPYPPPAMSFEEPVPLLPPLLRPGSTAWGGSYYRTPGDPLRYWWSVRVRALRWERMAVPAGRFEAIVVERQIAFEHPDRFRTDSRRAETLWWAPAVNRWVRRDCRETYLHVSDLDRLRDRRTEIWFSQQLLG